ncbi:DUF5819 family protein [Streptomyces sp. HU2014]|uniref:Membrane protein n=1 Tax=Streptomyces albireticuli TaxID=1940 RepID=A0A1Z2L4C0_9ACTN|nr:MULTISPECIES: DUF5819 family protein [Streptomyces]ARZ69118.1 membrane protein [Streptomyces albireticuli]UQI49010.1 DUF5819 family protein [Streptomyces sp. HU2014]
MGPDDERDGPGGGGAGPTRLSLPARVALAAGAAVVAVAAAVHIAMVFLHVSPSNTVSKQHAEAIGDYIYPEFEQNWKFFAPNPLQQNVAVQARAELRGPDGRTTLTRWTDLSAQDGAAIHHNLLPSHTQQNQLRRAWDFYTGTHDVRERPNGLRGSLSEEYIRRIAVARLSGQEGRQVQRVQVRSVTTVVAPPPWSDEKGGGKPSYRTLAWWPVTTADIPEANR